MRAALSALTTRGRCLLAAGLAAAACSLVLGEKDLLRVACFLIALPVLAAASVVRTRFKLRCSRRVEPGRVQVGQPARVVLELENVSYLPTGLLMLEDDLPYTLGGRPRFMLDRIRPGQTRTVQYPVRSDVRGRYRVGPLRLRLADPFGLVELTRSFNAVDTLLVVPAVQPLPAVRIGGAWSAGGESTSRAVAVRGDDDAATREYRHGDDLRKVHWRSTARTGKLMVRREERPWQSSATLLLDTRITAHRGDGPGASFEWAVSAVASIGVHLGRLGYTLRYATDRGPVQPGVDFAEGSVLLDHLAEAVFAHSTRMDGALASLRDGESTGTLIAVLGILDADTAQQLVSSRRSQDTSIAVLLDSATWASARVGSPAPAAVTPSGAPLPGTQAPASGQDAAADLLRTAGWTVLRAARGATMPALWPEASGRGGRLGALVAPAAPQLPADPVDPAPPTAPMTGRG